MHNPRLVTSRSDNVPVRQGSSPQPSGSGSPYVGQARRSSSADASNQGPRRRQLNSNRELLTSMLPSHIPGSVMSAKVRANRLFQQRVRPSKAKLRKVASNSRWIDLRTNLRQAVSPPEGANRPLTPSGSTIEQRDSVNSIQKDLLEVREMIPGTVLDHGITRKQELVRMLLTQKQIIDENEARLHQSNSIDAFLFKLTTMWASFQSARKRMWQGFLIQLFRLKIWRNDISRLTAEYGRNVGIYFKFLRWSLIINAALQLIWVLFVIIPYSYQVGFGEAIESVYGNNSPDASAANFFSGLISGSGAFLSSPFFYGSYGSPIVPKDGELPSIWSSADGRTAPSYDILVAYWVVSIFFIVISFIAIVVGLSWSIRLRHNSFRTVDYNELLSETTLAGFSYSVFTQSAIFEQQLALSQNLKALQALVDKNVSQDIRMVEKLWLWIKRIGVNAAILLILIAALFAINETVDSFIDSNRTFEKILPGVVLALFNALIPPIFEALAILERWPSREFLENINVIRASLLRYAGLYVFLFSTLRIAQHERCQESEIGRSAYATFMIASMLFDVLASAGLDMVWYATSKYVFKPIGPPYFDTVKRVLELVYAQALIWVGTLFSPVLPMLGIVRSIALFYIQSWSTITWCTRKSENASTNSSLETIVWSLLLFGMAVVLTPVAVGFSTLVPSGAYRDSVWQHNNMNWTLLSTTPVEECGPLDTLLSTCQLCLAPGQDPSQKVCWKPFTADNSNVSMVVGGTDYTEGFALPLGVLCLACPRGCGPFRNRPSFFNAIHEEYLDWPDWIKTIFVALGSPAATALIAAIGIVIGSVMSARSHARSIAVKHLELKYEVACEDVRMMTQSAVNSGLIFQTELIDVDGDGLRGPNDIILQMNDREGILAPRKARKSQLVPIISVLNPAVTSDGLNGGKDTQSDTKATRL